MAMAIWTTKEDSITVINFIRPGEKQPGGLILIWCVLIVFAGGSGGHLLLIVQDLEIKASKQ